MVFIQNESRMVGVVQGPGSWSYVRKNGKQSKVKEIFKGAVYKFNNFDFADVKGYHITGKYKIYAQNPSGEVKYIKNDVKVQEQAKECDCQSQIDSLRALVTKLMNDVENLKSTLNSQPVTEKILIPQSHRGPPLKMAYIDALEEDAILIQPYSVPKSIPICRVAEDFYIVRDCIAESVNHIYVEVDEEVPVKPYDERVVDDIFQRLSSFIRKKDVFSYVDKLNHKQTALNLFSFAEDVFGSYPPTSDRREVFFKVMSTLNINKIFYALHFCDNNTDYSKWFYAAILKYNYECKEKLLHPLCTHSLMEFCKTFLAISSV